MLPFQRIKFVAASALIVATSHLSQASEVTDQIAHLGLKEYAIPLSEKIERTANRSRFEYLVDSDGNRLVVHEVESLHGEIVKGKDAVQARFNRRVPPAVLSKFQAARLERPGGPVVAFEAGAITYVGANSGEFGGGLYALRENGTVQKLLPDNVVEILQVKDELWVFTGLNHMGMSTGTVWRINGYRTDPRVERLTLLPGTPRVVLKGGRYYQDSVLVVTSDVIFELGTFTELEMHIDTIDGFWGGLFPTSAVQIGTELVIGMRGGIAVFPLPTFFGRPPGPVRFFADHKKNSAQ